MPVSRLLRCAAPRLAALPTALALTACSPALDWRDVAPEGNSARLLMPCKPTAQQRRVQLAGQSVPLTLYACSAGGVTWALALADVNDPSRVGVALAELGQSAADNISARVPAVPSAAASASPPPPAASAAQVLGATPNAASRRLALQGRLPDGQDVAMHVALFTYGTWVYQATALGPVVRMQDAEVFFQSLRLRP